MACNRLTTSFLVLAEFVGALAAVVVTAMLVVGAIAIIAVAGVLIAKLVALGW